MPETKKNRDSDHWVTVLNMFVFITSLQCKVVKQWCPKLVLARHIFKWVELSIVVVGVVNGVKISGQIEYMVSSLLFQCRCRARQTY